MKPADEPQVHIAPNSSRPWLVLIAIGSGTHPYAIAPALADDLAGQLTAAAATARMAAGVIR